MSAEPVRIGLGGEGRRIDLDLAGSGGEFVILGVVDLRGESDRVLGRGEAGDALLA